LTQGSDAGTAQDAALRPHEPAIFAHALPLLDAKLGPELEDFVVEELPLYPASGSGEHLYAQIEKRGMTTPQMVRAVSRAAGVEERDVGYAGLKDKHAVTTQWLSLPVKARPLPEWRLPEGVRVLESTRHGNKLRTGHLLGNRFRIRLVSLEPDGLERARAIAAFIVEQGLLNYFGGQRFGRDGDSLRQALDWLRAGARLHGAPRFLLKLYPSVLQAEVFNRYLSLRRARELTRLIPGEVVRLEGTGSMFVVEDVTREQPRYDAGDLHLTGPIFGPKTRPAAADGAELEAAARAALALSDEQAQTLARQAPGTRRDLRVKVGEISVERVEVDRLELAFALPSGSYATEVVRQFTGGAFLIEERDRGGEA
jgi:tRNA pseudouridine13 synthase